MEKSPEAFRTIGEVSDLLETPAHVLRFWETRFPQVRPVKRAGGRRYYRPSDVALLAGLRVLLHDNGMTIKGAQKILREEGVRHVVRIGEEAIGLSEAVDAEEGFAEIAHPPSDLGQSAELDQAEPVNSEIDASDPAPVSAVQSTQADSADLRPASEKTLPPVDLQPDMLALFHADVAEDDSAAPADPWPDFTRAPPPAAPEAGVFASSPALDRTADGGLALHLDTAALIALRDRLARLRDRMRSAHDATA